MADYYAQGSQLTDLGGYTAEVPLLDLSRFREDYAQRVIADHELGHVWQNDFTDKERASWQAAIVKCTIRSIAAVSSYATTDQAECFAEMFSAYVNGAGEALPEACRAWFDARIEPIFVRQTPHRDRPLR